MPQRFAGGDHRVARGGVPDFVGPERERVAVLDGAHQEGVPLARRGDVRIAPQVEGEGRRQEGGAGEVGLVGWLDRFDGAALRGGRAETGIPVGDGGETRPGRGHGVGIGQVRLRLEAFVADPECVPAVDAGGNAAGGGRARQRDGEGVDLPGILEAEAIDVGGQLDGTTADQRDQHAVRCAGNGVRKVIDQPLTFGGRGIEHLAGGVEEISVG